MASLWDEQIGDCTISRALKKIGFTRKKRPMATANGMKKNDRHLQGSCPQYPLRRLSILMNQGWIVCINMIMVGTRCGQRFHALKSGRRQGRVNIIAALCNQNPIAPFTIEGACNRTVLETWLESCLLPTLTIGQVVVMDNATFHKGGRIRELIETAGCQLLYLPPYSPDLNLH